MVKLLGPKFAQNSRFVKIFAIFCRRDQFWTLDHYYTSYLNIDNNNFQISDIFEKSWKFTNF